MLRRPEPGFSEQGVDARVDGVAHPPGPVQFLDHVVDGALVVCGVARDTARLQVGDGAGLDAGRLRDRCVHEPFVLRAPEARRRQDGKFGKPGRQGRAVAAMRAELLGEIAEFRRV
jgi:hypothetical protein